MVGSRNLRTTTAQQQMHNALSVQCNELLRIGLCSFCSFSQRIANGALPSAVQHQRIGAPPCTSHRFCSYREERAMASPERTLRLERQRASSSTLTSELCWVLVDADPPGAEGRANCSLAQSGTVTSALISPLEILLSGRRL